MGQLEQWHLIQEKEFTVNYIELYTYVYKCLKRIGYFFVTKEPPKFWAVHVIYVCIRVNFLLRYIKS